MGFQRSYNRRRLFIGRFHRVDRTVGWNGHFDQIVLNVDLFWRRRRFSRRRNSGRFLIGRHFFRQCFFWWYYLTGNRVGHVVAAIGANGILCLLQHSLGWMTCMKIRFELLEIKARLRHVLTLYWYHNIHIWRRKKKTRIIDIAKGNLQLEKSIDFGRPIDPLRATQFHPASINTPS